MLRYLASTIDKGITIQWSEKLEVDCCADTYFVGLWGVKHEYDPISVKLRTWFVIKFM